MPASFRCDNDCDQYSDILKTMEKYYTADAIILRGKSYGEGNRIFTFYSKEQGKFSAVARGVLKQKSKLKGHLQLGNRCTLQLARGKGMDTVSSAMATETFPALREKADRYFYLSYFLELFNDFVPEELPDEDLFDLLFSVLRRLGDTDPKTVARYFELRLLAVSGYAPDVGECALCGRTINGGYLNRRYHGIICPHCGGGLEVTPKAHFALKYLATEDIRIIHRLKIDEPTANLLGELTKQMIETSLEKKVKSLDILKQI